MQEQKKESVSPNIQVQKEHYAAEKYDTLERFISYHYQITSVLKLKPQSVLEIGIGNRLVSSYLKREGVSVTTVDFDKELQPDIVADVRSMPVPDKSFDLVTACQILEHIPFEDFEDALQEIQRITKRHVVISLPRRSSYFEIVIKFPFIRTLLKRSFIDIAINKHITFGGFKTSGQHYFEIDRSRYKMSKVREKILRYFTILDEFSPVLNQYHRFFILERKEQPSNES